MKMQIIKIVEIPDNVTPSLQYRSFCVLSNDYNYYLLSVLFTFNPIGRLL